ncbi:MAG: hypothetical protein HC866_07705 [Leptolyngbyaceae cyanobacterium RU_5_1]|nr:hypothetical protein [Leptolyngbyaceae cyanobacterium RU_5_1]
MDSEGASPVRQAAASRRAAGTVAAHATSGQAPRYADEDGSDVDSPPTAAASKPFANYLQVKKRTNAQLESAESPSTGQPGTFHPTAFCYPRSILKVLQRRFMVFAEDSCRELLCGL